MNRHSIVYFVFISIISFFYIGSINAQFLINNGNSIVVSTGAYLVVEGDIVNKTATDDGRIDLDGQILLDGDFENYSTNEVFINQEAVTDGLVVLRNCGMPQSIKGTSPIHFENLTILGSVKTLEVTNASVSDVLTVNAVLDLNSNNFILFNSNPSSIQYVSKYIKSETTSFDGYGTLDWRIGNNTQHYTIPFGTGESNFADVPVSYTSLSAGFPSSAGIKFATYPTGDRMNTPCPNGIFSLTPYDPMKVADRFWITNADAYSSIPTASLEFKYRNQDIENGNSITESELKAVRISDGGTAWNEVAPVGVVTVANNTMSVQNISPSDWRNNWALTSIGVDGDFWVPGAYTPNEDYVNAIFKPVFGFQPKSYQFTVYNRWGERLYDTSDYLSGWDGTYKSQLAKQDVYIWVISMIRPDGMLYKYQGNFAMVIWE